MPQTCMGLIGIRSQLIVNSYDVFTQSNKGTVGDRVKVKSIQLLVIKQ